MNLHALIPLHQRIISFIEPLQSFLMLLIRLSIAKVFFASGLVKIGDFGNAVALFQDEYQVPFLPPMTAAVFATVFELACPALLTIGLASRLAVLPLLAMTAVIQFTYDQNIQHYYWAILLAMILFYGPGKLSIDHLIARNFNNGDTK